jgi:hypothetical protein
MRKITPDIPLCYWSWALEIVRVRDIQPLDYGVFSKDYPFLKILLVIKGNKSDYSHVCNFCKYLSRERAFADAFNLG